eukprot:Opistho-2@18760
MKMQATGYLVVLVMCVAGAAAVSFELPGASQKCFKEDVHKGLLISGSYHVSEGENQRIDILISDSQGFRIWAKTGAVSGRFSFAPDEEDTYELCFKNVVEEGAAANADMKREITFTLSKGTAGARDYDEAAQAAQLRPLEVQLRVLEDLSSSIVHSFNYMKEREASMRDTNESTNSRVLYFTVFSMLCLMGLGGWQVYYLKRFFQAKKLIQ